MDAWERILLTLICLPSIYSSIKIIVSIEPLNLFLLIGFLSLILMVLTKYKIEITVIFLYIPATFSFILLLLHYPQPIIGLAAGYMISLPIFMTLATFKETSPHTYLILYLISILLDMGFLTSSKEPLTPGIFIRNVLHGFGRLPGAVTADFIFSILMVPSIAALLCHIFRPLEPLTGTILSEYKSLLALPLSAIPILGLTILSKISPTLAWISSFILAFMLTLFLTIYLRVIEH
ncbi:MAG: hypothetical protein DRN68_05150 [Thaumarchaeota archaeon]|nr:MAG: hypothetical protein DRN68_05150 [Nitrososphaerota archaeon]